MMNYVSYEATLQEQLNELKTTKRPIVLFGTMDMALFGKQVIDFLKLKITCFVDNDCTKWGRIIDEIPVLSPEDVEKLYPDAKIYVCSFQNKSIKEIMQQLHKMNFQDAYNCDMLFYLYQLGVRKRPISGSDLAKTLYILGHRENKTIVCNANFFITEKCTLNCRDCSTFVPYYKTPCNHNKEIIIESIKMLSKSVDAIERVTILGGETFLHSDLVEICEAVSNLPNVGYITITTNGTIVPKLCVIESLSKHITYFNISNYGKLSTKKQELISMLTEYNIPYIMLQENAEWYKFGPPKKHNRALNENDDIFKSCKWLTCSWIISGVYYACPFLAHSSAFKLIPELESDCVNLLDTSLTSEEKKQKMKDYLTKTNCLTACDYCNFFYEIPVPRALQAVGKLQFDEEE